MANLGGLYTYTYIIICFLFGHRRQTAPCAQAPELAFVAGTKEIAPRNQENCAAHSTRARHTRKMRAQVIKLSRRKKKVFCGHIYIY